MTRPETDQPQHSADQAASFANLLQQRPLKLMAEAAGTTACHVVGGALRDTALGLEYRDLDLVVEGAGLSIAQRLASSLPARLVELGGDRFAAYRLVAHDLTLDIWDRQGDPLEVDLARRDLTIHSFAVEISDGAVVDPFLGLADLGNKLLRATSETSFSSDPLRVLRLARFAGQLPGFKTPEPTLELAFDSAADLVKVAGERIRVELETLLELPDFLTSAELLVRLALYPGLWQSRSGCGQLEDPAGLINRLHHLELFLDLAGKRADRAIARQAILFDQLVSDQEQSATETVESARQNGLLTRATSKKLNQLLGWVALPLDTVSQRWYLHRSGSLWPTVTCFLAARDPSFQTEAAFRGYLDGLDALCRDSGAEIFDPEPLISARDLIDHLDIPEGRMLGQILATIQRRQVEGGISTRDDALALATEFDLHGSGTKS